jgi:hypothetical protein
MRITEHNGIRQKSSKRKTEDHYETERIGIYQSTKPTLELHMAPSTTGCEVRECVA